VTHGYADWRAFAIAGMRAGTPYLLHPPELWQAFVYLPAAAWAIAPLSRLPIALGFAIDCVVMVGCAVGASFVASRLYGITRTTMLCLTFAWWPTLYAALVVGQNATLGLLLALLTIAGMARESVARTAIPLGLLLYKPTYALPLIVVLIVRGRWRELGGVAACGVPWYLASVAATGGDWFWPRTLAGLIRAYAAQDFRVNGRLSVSLPGILVHAGIALPAIVVLVFAIAALSIQPLRRVSARECGSAASLIGLALSPHAWAYDAVLALPMITFAAARLAEPTRTPLIVASYVLAPLALLTPVLQFDPLAIVVLGGTLAWIAVRSSPSAMWSRSTHDDDTLGYGRCASQHEPQKRGAQIAAREWALGNVPECCSAKKRRGDADRVGDRPREKSRSLPTDP